MWVNASYLKTNDNFTNEGILLHVSESCLNSK